MKQSSAINPLLNAMGEDVMGFLNEVQERYPNAISLASGRPDEQYFDFENFAEYFNAFVEHEAANSDNSKSQVIKRLGQYNAAKGVVNDLAAQFLKNDEGIEVSAEDVILTVGTQEAMAIAVLTLCDQANDILLVEDPCYIGITHFSCIAGYHIKPVSVLNDGISLEQIEEHVQAAKTQGKKVKLVYTIPDFQNPTGNSMSIEKRKQLLAMAEQYDFFILEDNAYGDFRYYGEHKPTLKALDVNQRVIYFRSFSKTLYPTIRLSILATDRKVENNGEHVSLCKLMAKTKGYLTVNTSSINQGVFAGMLLKNKCSFLQMNKEKIDALKQKRDHTINMLKKHFSPQWASEILWNEPDGGFFLTVKLPFKVNKDAVTMCAEEHQVIFTPMSFFYLNDGGESEIRLAFSYLSLEEIEMAIERLTNYCKIRITETQLADYERNK